MFRKTDPQRSMLESEFLIPAEKRERLKRSWAEPFRKHVLSLIDEEVFRDAFSETRGRPNRSIQLLTCLHLLKEWNDLTDAQVLEQLEFNLQWHYALGLEPDETHLCQKTLHNYRVRLMNNARAKKLFEQVTKALAEADGLNLDRQRLDSTHILSNIAVLTRLGLFVETVTNFLKELRRENPSALGEVDRVVHRRYLEREGYFSDAKREQAQRRLPVVANDVYWLVATFEAIPKVSALPSFEILVRLFEEQCEVVVSNDDEGDAGNGEGGVKVVINDDAGSGEVRTSDDADKGDDEGNDRGVPRAQVIEPQEVDSQSLQSPHDPDATYGHKGKGYEAQISETCDKDNPYQVITATSVGGAHESDQNAVKPMLDQLDNSGMLPKEMQTDTGYGSGKNIVESAQRGVELVCPVPDPNAPGRHDPFLSEGNGEHASAEETVLPQDNADDVDATLGLEAFTYNETYDRIVGCPAGHPPVRQSSSPGRLHAVFSSEQCATCSKASVCPTRCLSGGDRQLQRAMATVATAVRQAEQQTENFKERYRIRSGIESTNEELKGAHGMRDIRVRGKPRVVLVVQLKTLALNVKRAMQYHVSVMARCAPCPV